MKTIYSIQIHKKCLKELEKIPGSYRREIQKKIEALASEPKPYGCLKLSGSNKTSLYRIRCGDYRIIYTIQENVLLIVIVEIGHRKEIYRHF